MPCSAKTEILKVKSGEKGLSSQGKREEINISAQKLEMKRESCAHDKHYLESLTSDKWVCGPESVISL